MNEQDDYTYLPLRDATSALGMKVNIYAVIVEFGIPKKSKGTDLFSVIKVKDPCYHCKGLSINFFSESTTKLPQIKSAGDVIRLHRIMMKIHNGEVYALFNKKFSSFALFDGPSSKEFTPYQASSKIYVKENDKAFITHLRTWFANYQPDSGNDEYVLQLRGIKEHDYFDLVCKIIHVCKVPEDEWMLFVWDGTDTPPSTLQMKLEIEAEIPLPLQFESSPLPRDVLCKFPRVGTVLRIVADKFFEESVLKIQVGQWAKFRKVTCRQHYGIWHGLVGHSSRLCPLPDGDNAVVQRQRCYSERISSEPGRLPLSSFPWPSDVTATNYERVSFSTLMDVLTHSEVTYKFKCVVRVVTIYPWLAEDFRSPIGTRIYRIRFTLEDPTARIHAYVYDEDGVNFFGGYPPADVISEKMNKLLGISENAGSVSRNPPWVQCCIKSYYLNKKDPWGSRRFRIFGTRLIG